MSFRGVTFNKQTCRSEDDALIFDTFLNSAVGRVRGVAVTYDDESIYIAPGYFMTYGRLVNVVGTETLTPEAIATGTQYNRLVFTIDLSLENTASEFNQGYFEFLSSYDEYPSLTQEDLFDGGTVFQIPICKFELTVDGIQSFVEDMGVVNISEVWATIEDDLAEYRSQFADVFAQYESDIAASKAQAEADCESLVSDFSDYETKQKEDLLAWLEEMKGILDEDTAGNLQNEIDALAQDVFERYYGLKTTTTEFLSDGSIVQSNEEAVVTTVFETLSTGEKIITETVAPAEGAYNYVKTTTITPATSTANKTITETYTSTIKG
ncbi:MAG: hypothetical protein LUI12_11015 [Clostridiales bacterium]|nr:hypothetical protein [Clostridiales bacterium]